ncbi:hypothetical protein LPJ70_001832 [Coemansia sp. RSA 2708]|nr:hypothetical protein LPJ70_001832 [Coemansia sp. RSA 2708]
MEFSQRPAHYAASTHYPYAGQDAQQVYYAQPQPHPAEAYASSPRRLPSVSELLVTPDAPQQAVSAHPYAPTRFAVADRPAAQHYVPGAYGPGAYPVADVSKAYGIDVPAPRAPDYGAPAYRDSESAASSVSSQGTMVDNYSPAAHRAAAKQLQQPSGMCEDDVFTAASILMSLRTCKMPC